MVTVLNGEWDFKYYEKDMLIPKEFYTDRVQFDKVTVPSTWQRTGYEPPVYLNCPYEIETKPPMLPDDMSAGIYRKTFNISDTDKVYFINFLVLLDIRRKYILLQLHYYLLYLTISKHLLPILRTYLGIHLVIHKYTILHILHQRLLPTFS